uniref:SCP domain-containing protein n=1 Tax=Glossina palpalis gambiensis TaxID=67801 RepID=A0A1B0BPH9_9MUSC
MTRKIKRYFLEFFNSLRNNISSGAYTLSNGQTFPIAARMREVIWDNELEFMMQTWVRAGKESKLDCIGSQRLNFVYTKLFTSPQKYKLPFFKIVDLTLLAYTKNMDGISNTKEVQSYGTAMRNSKADAFITTIQERMSRIGCSAAVGLNGTERPTGPIIPYVYFVACALDFENKGSQVIYKVHPTDSASECDYWGATRSKKYPNLCTNTGEIFPYVEELVPPV